MKNKKWVSIVLGAAMVSNVLVGCSKGEVSKEPGAKDDNLPLNLNIAIAQVGDVPTKGNEIEQAMEKYTNTKLDIQWIPGSAYDDKVNVMIASGELPKLLKVKYTPSIVGAMRNPAFWEVGPFLKEYKNLSAQNPVFFQNYLVDGKLYGVPLFGNFVRAGLIVRKDWMTNLNLHQPKTIDDWYNVVKAMTLNDPDKNGKNDTYGLILNKDFIGLTMVRLAVSLGAPNKWKVENGKFIPDFMTKEYVDVLKLIKRLYDDKLINQDFAVLDSSEGDKMWDAGRGGLKVAVASTAKSQEDRLLKVVPAASLDVMPLEGPGGIRVPSEGGGGTILVIPKSSVKTEVEMKKILAFMDKLMDEPMATMLRRGIEGKHFIKTDGKTEFKDFSLFQREVKPYRDNLPNKEGYNMPPLKDVPMGEKGDKIELENEKYMVANPALNLNTTTFSERGKELETMMNDAQIKFIMGKIDEAGFQGEIEKWKKAGGSQLIEEFSAEYAKVNNMRK